MAEYNGKCYIATQFDMQSLEVSEAPVDMTARPIGIDEIEALNPISLIRDEDTARVVSDELGFEIKAEARNATFKRGDSIIVPIFIAGLDPDGTVSPPYVAIDHFVRVSIAPF